MEEIEILNNEYVIVHTKKRTDRLFGVSNVLLEVKCDALPSQTCFLVFSLPSDAVVPCWKSDVARAQLERVDGGHRAGDSSASLERYRTCHRWGQHSKIRKICVPL